MNNICYLIPPSPPNTDTLSVQSDDNVWHGTVVDGVERRGGGGCSSHNCANWHMIVH